MRPSNPVDLEASVDDASLYEQTHVHEVYDAIADHFSATRYSPWPLVAQFLARQPAGSIGLDVGCGNGKYLSGASSAPPPSSLPPPIPGTPQRFILGSDRSAALAALAYEKHAHHRVGADVLLADSLALPFRDGCADFIICIAVVHHLSTRKRRQAAVKELLRCVRQRDVQQDPVQQPEPQQRQPQPPAPSSTTPGTPAPSFLPPSPSPTAPSSTASSASPSLSASRSGRVLIYVWALEQATSRRGWTAGGEQDLLVPWVKTMRDKNQSKVKGKGGKKMHEEKEQQAGVDNKDEQGVTTDREAQQPHVPPTFHRYYHLYKQGELEDDVAAAGGHVVACGYEKDNWWVVADPL
ncbi:hypothetical protein SPBR_01866 [Sporothrix brasiliensis 5110]|uniref:Methyltransferase type 11 domain-containing protein n=1 Tax=Sporothrix brasiliensis 5110 TaxID=1398154 RepID=A0A0C2IRB7_9PEZI|nr:uncharacterized protein SPBR_01866 [Sporothrix brasiliensis 5110]KIH91566.1 hypothetical protein SPBR_01866 [Sporothrix brasiliensis 5110]